LPNFLTILVALGFLALFVWLLIPEKKKYATGDSDEPFIDPDDSYQIGLLMGMYGGSVPEAAVMRFALQRFQEIHGRRATTRDIGLVIGLIEKA
jgi:hypothetical protein